MKHKLYNILKSRQNGINDDANIDELNEDELRKLLRDNYTRQRLTMNYFLEYIGTKMTEIVNDDNELKNQLKQSKVELKTAEQNLESQKAFQSMNDTIDTYYDPNIPMNLKQRNLQYIRQYRVCILYFRVELKIFQH